MSKPEPKPHQHCDCHVCLGWEIRQLDSQLLAAQEEIARLRQRMFATRRSDTCTRGHILEQQKTIADQAAQLAELREALRDLLQTVEKEHNNDKCARFCPYKPLIAQAKAALEVGEAKPGKPTQVEPGQDEMGDRIRGNAALGVKE